MTKELYPKIYLYRRVVQAKLFIDEHYGEAIDLGNISQEALFSRFHFIRLFTKMYGKTPHQYLIHVRIEKARIMLSQAIPVTDVCYAVGFDSTSSFAGLFKRVVGLSPSAYKAQQLQLKAAIAKTPLKYIPNCFAEKEGWSKNSNFGEVIL